METELRGLYVITDRHLIPPGHLVDQVEAAIEGGARLVQYRDKSDDGARRHEEAGALLALCGHYGIPLIINDDVALAQRIDAAGVHLGRGDSALDSARARLGPHALIGISCYASLERALAAERAGANYVAFGSVFPSSTKPEAESVDLALIDEAHNRLSIPVCAIGGITPENAARVIAAGADMVAVVSGVFAAPDPRRAADSISRLFEPPEASLSIQP